MSHLLTTSLISLSTLAALNFRIVSIAFVNNIIVDYDTSYLHPNIELMDGPGQSDLTIANPGYNRSPEASVLTGISPII